MNIKTMKIGKIEKIPFKGYLYDLTAMQNHNYIANGVVIHNCEGTPGRALLETGRFTTKEVDLRLRMFVKRLDFSSHLDRKELFSFVKKMNPEKIFCVHGDDTVTFAKELKDEGFDAVAPVTDNRVFNIE